ncbi:MAG: M23 family metallopeptidase [Alphaproteobacteria bacterium]
MIAFSRDDKKTQYLTLTDSQNSSYRVKLEVSPAAWDIQNLKGIPPRKVTPSNSDLRAIEKEQSLVRKAQKNDSELANWQAGFIQPVKGRISGNFGGQRIMNGIKKNPHSGMDIAAPEAHPVKAASDGVVTWLSRICFLFRQRHHLGSRLWICHHLRPSQQNGRYSRETIVKRSGYRPGRQNRTRYRPHLHWELR